MSRHRHKTLENPLFTDLSREYREGVFINKKSFSTNQDHILSSYKQLFLTFVGYCKRFFNTNRNLPTTAHIDNHIIAEIRAGRETTLRRIYPLHATAFKAWARQYFRCSEADLADAYQEALIAFYRNVTTGQLTELRSSLKTYLFVIGYRHLRRSILKHQNIELLADLPENQLPNDPHFLENMIAEEEYQHQRAHLRQAIGQLAPSCQRVLELYFYQGLSIPQIKEALNYESENSVSVQKSRCLKALRDVLNG